MLKQKGKKITLGRVFVYLVLISILIVYMIPFYGIIVVSLKPMKEIFTNAWSLPANPTFETFRIVWEDGIAGIKPYFWNSIKMIIPSIIICISVSLLLAFAITKMKWRLSNAIYYFMVFGLSLPLQILIIPVFFTINAAHLYDTTWALIWIHSAFGIPFSTFILRNFMIRVPDELLDAAKIDGCNMFSVFFRIILPLSITSIVVLIIFEFTFIYNELFFALILTPSLDTAPVPRGIAMLALGGPGLFNWNWQAAASILSAIPTVIVFLALQRYFMKGVMLGALKE